MLTLALVFVILMLIGIPISVSMLGASLVYIIENSGSLEAIPHRLVSSLDSFVLVAVPMFLFVGGLMSGGDILGRLLELSNQLVGRLKGGLAQINIVVSMLFAGISGTATGDTAAIGSTLIPSMIKEKYDPPFAAAVTAASSTIGPLFPPSVPMIVLGGLVGISVGQLFLAGVAPGLFVGLALLIVAYIISGKRSYGRPDATFSLRLLGLAIVRAIGPLAIPAIIVGGIIGGVFTPTEASAIAVVVILLLGIVVYRNLTARAVTDAVRGTLYLTGPVLFVVATASQFSNLLIQERAGQLIVAVLTDMSENPTIVLLLIALATVILGMFLEALAIIILLAPVLMPVVSTVGIDPVHFGLVLIQAALLGLITPPVGICMFLAMDIANVRMQAMVRALAPFYFALLASLAASIFLPDVVLFLPRLAVS